MISSQITTPLIKIFWITIVWILIAISWFFTGYGTLVSFNCDYSAYDPMLSFLIK